MERFDFFRIQDIVSHVREFTSQEWLFYGGLGVGAMSLLFVAVKTVVRRWRGPPATPVASKTLQDIKSVQDAIAVEDIGPSGKQGYLKQPFEAFLVLDVEGTCEEGSSFDYPNEIIEMPVALMEWKSRLSGGKSRELVLKAEFHTFVKPSWKPALSTFCKKLTGITQKEIDAAPDFPEALSSLEQFLTDQGLIDPTTGERKMNFCWCTDGPFDIRDFMVKQAFISQVPLPGWIQGQVLDVRQMVADWCKYGTANQKKRAKKHSTPSRNIVAQLRALELPQFEGRQHSGRDDTRNVCRILAELARRGMRLQPNTTIRFNRRWPWMGRNGRVVYGQSDYS